MQQFSKLHEEPEQIARIQSVKSSNAIEGIITADERILAIVNKRDADGNRRIRFQPSNAADTPRDM